ncbi:hypothetical protein [Lacticaseibacillus pantheris]|uniref:hypothetical protein n=1 Tax=Lacticaseibacillus pantheris TaxID=171523 RepID=UPI0026590AD0|nr:hypothetical protein [Lacticaseibacillus pantheris]WKF84155.1 hypothetical protein QY874_07600 [Lacticaseibacillus pantheris]
MIVIPILALCLICPALGIIVGLWLIIQKSRPTVLLLAVVSLVFGYIGSFYVFKNTDDMYRYVQYMLNLQGFGTLKDYIGALYSDGGFSTFGLNAKTWPLSGVIMYFASRGNPLYTYRILSGGTLAFTIFTRLYLVCRLIRVENSRQMGAFIRFTFIAALIFTAPPLRVLSGFRWWLSSSACYLVVVYIVTHTNSKHLSLVATLGFLLAGLLHPMAYIYMAIWLLIRLAFSERNALLKVMISVPVILVMVLYILRTGALTQLMAQGMAYIRVDESTYDFIFNIIISIASVFSVATIFHYRNALGKQLSLYLVAIQCVTISTFFFDVFDRFYQFSVPMILITVLIIIYKLNIPAFLSVRFWLSWFSVMLIYALLYVVNFDSVIPSLGKGIISLLFWPVKVW